MGGNREGSALRELSLLQKDDAWPCPVCPQRGGTRGGASLLHRRAVPAPTYPSPPRRLAGGDKGKKKKGKLCAAGGEHNNYKISFHFIGCAIHETYCTTAVLQVNTMLYIVVRCTLHTLYNTYIAHQKYTATRNPGKPHSWSRSVCMCEKGGSKLSPQRT